jgi:uncharacterized membrane protein
MESEIVEIGTSLAPLGNSIGLTEQQVLAFSTAIAASGGKTEAASTAFQKTASSMKQAVISGGKELEKFAKITGQSADEFQQSFKKDASGAILDFLEGLGRIQKEGGSTASVLEDLGLADQRLQREFGKLTGNIDQARKAMGVSNDAFERNTALTEEAQKRYATFNSRVKILWNNLYDLGVQIGNALMPAVNSLIDGSKSLIGWFSDLSDNTKTWLAVTATIAAVIGPVIVAMGIFASSLSSIGTAMLFLSSTAIPAVIGALESLYLVALLNPVVAAITAITAAVGLLGYAAVRSHKKTKKLWDYIAQLKGVDVESESWRDLEKRIDSIKAKIKDANKSVISQMTTDPAAYKELNDQLKIFEDRLREIRPLIFKTGQMIAEELGGTVFEALNNKKDTGPLIYRQKVKVETDVVTDTGGVMPEVPVKPVIQSIKPKDWEPIVDIDIPELEPDLGVPADSIAYVQEEIAKMERAITLATSQGERDRLNIRKSSLEKQLESMKTQGEEAMELGQALQTALSNAFAALGETLSDIFTGDGGATTFFNKMLSIIASFMSTFGKLMIAFGVAKAELSFSGNPFVAIAAGVALIAVAGAIKSHLNNGPEDTPKLAKGGLAFGPTMAVVGDNKGARSNPEVIAPLDKLKSMMGNMGGTQRVIVEGRLRGSDIFISNKRGQDIFR